MHYVNRRFFSPCDAAAEGKKKSWIVGLCLQMDLRAKISFCYVHCMIIVFKKRNIKKRKVLWRSEKKLHASKGYSNTNYFYLPLKVNKIRSSLPFLPIKSLFLKKTFLMHFVEDYFKTENASGREGWRTRPNKKGIYPPEDKYIFLFNHV